jgi:quercetin dioxygenase-like cupin family protein
MTNSKEFFLSTFLNSENEQFHLARTTITSSNDLQLHHHDYAEIFWISEGNGFHLINGQTVPIKKGSLAIIRPEDSHTFTLSKPNQRMVITNLAFRKSHMEFYLSRYFPYLEAFFPPINELLFTTQLTPELESLFSSQADQIFAEPRDIMHLDMMVLFIFHALHEHVTVNTSIPHWLSYALEHYSSPVFLPKAPLVLLK